MAQKRELEGKQDEETIRRLKHDVLPYIGDMTFPQLTLEVLEVKIFQRIIDRGALSVAERLKSDLNQIFKSARKRSWFSTTQLRILNYRILKGKLRSSNRRTRPSSDAG